MNCLFIDSGYFIALEALDDQNHKIASIHWKTLCKSLPQLLTTSYVFDEVITFFNSKGKHDKAVELGKNILDSPAIKLIHINEALFNKSWEYLKQHDDKTYSFTDCTSFVLMKQRKITKALTFDRHFKQAGFEMFP
ncbi:MAG: type II toxin-antitoxin system VapC family toxin [Desulfamplus sp.]|nr:type II toxin-antitoxin system VapC family toxin [Desulfamplus sp.]